MGYYLIHLSVKGNGCETQVTEHKSSLHDAGTSGAEHDNGVSCLLVEDMDKMSILKRWL